MAPYNEVYPDEYARDIGTPVDTTTGPGMAERDHPRDDPLPAEPFTELGYARRLIHVYGPWLRHVGAWNRWLVWDGRRWVHDTEGQAARWQKIIARRVTNAALDIADEAARKAALHLARRHESAAGVAGALRLASTENEVAIGPDELDAHPHLLNCPNGVLDLRLAELQPHDPALLLTKITNATYDPDATGELFPGFLAGIQPDQVMRDYLARLLGGCGLLGEVVDHVLGILWGSGANGKSTLMAAVDHALGDYAAPADPELLTARSFDAHPTGTADLFGLRLAVLHEADRGRRLAEGTVKRLTGGDRIKARRMREDFWSFEPSHTFVMLTNHKPIITGNDEGLWRRVRLVPFTVSIPEADRDTRLPEKLAAEADAVLAWLVRGHIAWRVGGLADPPAVVDATAEYRRDSDTHRRFLDECCLLGPYHRCRSSDLFGRWRAWCKREGTDEPGTHKAFTTAVQDLGYDTDRTSVGVFWLGIGIAAEDDEAGP
jgi:putative DNA primase/helicase